LISHWRICSKFYGYPRATADIDIWIAINLLNAVKMVDILKDFGFNVAELSFDIFLQQNKIVRPGNAPVHIEILTNISGVNFEDLKKPVHEKKIWMILKNYHRRD